MQHLEDAENYDALLAQITLSASKATVLLRSVGIPLPEQQHAPSLKSTVAHLSNLVGEAIFSFHQIKEFEAPVNVLDAEIEGFADDELFDVVVNGTMRPKAFEVSILLRLC